MHEGKFVFSQLMEFVPWRRFQTCVNRYRGDYKVGMYQCVEQFRVMAFFPLGNRYLEDATKTAGSTVVGIYRAA